MIGFLADGLVIIGVSEFWKMVIKGSVIILAVAIDQAQQRPKVAKKKASEVVDSKKTSSSKGNKTRTNA